MINRYYASDCKVKPNGEKEIKVIREDDLRYVKSLIAAILEDQPNYVYDSIMEVLEIKDCFGNEE